MWLAQFQQLGGFPAPAALVSHVYSGRNKQINKTKQNPSWLSPPASSLHPVNLSQRTCKAPEDLLKLCKRKTKRSAKSNNQRNTLLLCISSYYILPYYFVTLKVDKNTCYLIDVPQDQSAFPLCKFMSRQLAYSVSGPGDENDLSSHRFSSLGNKELYQRLQVGVEDDGYQQEKIQDDVHGSVPRSPFGCVLETDASAQNSTESLVGYDRLQEVRQSLPPAPDKSDTRLAFEMRPALTEAQHRSGNPAVCALWTCLSEKQLCFNTKLHLSKLFWKYCIT